MAITTPMTYTALEALVGDFVQDAGLTRYDQDDRQRGIVWAEVQALRHLPEDDVRNLILTEGIASDANGVIITEELEQTSEVTTGAFVTGVTYIIKTVGDTDFTAIGAESNTVGVVFIATGAGGGTTGKAIVSKRKLFGVVDIYNTALTPNTHFKQMPQEMLLLRDNLMFKYGHHWYYLASSNTGLGSLPQIQLKANTDGDYKSVADSALFLTYKVFPSSHQGVFGATLVPFERNEELIAIGAAGFIWDQDGDARGQELLQKFYQGIGFSDDSARRT